MTNWDKLGQIETAENINLFIPCLPFSLSPPLPSPPRRDNLGICVQIIARRVLPGEILPHPVLLEFAPDVAVVIDHQGLVKGLGQAVARIVIEFIAVSATRGGFEVVDSVVQAADAAHDRYGSVPQAVHLI